VQDPNDAVSEDDEEEEVVVEQHSTGVSMKVLGERVVMP
jgi:hypothetical protein